MKQIFPLTIITVAVSLLVSCGSADKKADPGAKPIENKIDSNSTATVTAPPVVVYDTTKTADSASVTTTTPKVTSKKSKSISTTQSGQSRGVTRGMPKEPGDILADINEYLISKADFKALPAGGFTNGLITLTNTLPDVTFQKVLVEVIIKKQDGAAISSPAYYTLLGIEPGMSKLIKIPNSTLGTEVVTQVVKVKSNELTKGEWVLAGNHYVAQ